MLDKRYGGWGRVQPRIEGKAIPKMKVNNNFREKKCLTGLESKLFGSEHGSCFQEKYLERMTHLTRLTVKKKVLKGTVKNYWRV